MQRIIIDTDAGIDDALALLYALGSAEASIEAITTVAGNVSVGQATRNVGEVLRLEGSGRAFLMARGASMPLAGLAVRATEIHGGDGLAGWTVDRPRPELKLETAPAWEVIPRLARRFPGEITLVAIGPLTNVALALGSDAEGVRRLKEIVAMGGAILEPGNISAVAEFNVYADPEAARIVLGSGVPLLLMGLDVTQRAVLRREQLEAWLAARSGPRHDFLRQVCGHLFAVYGRRGAGEIFCLHDPAAMAAALDRPLVVSRRMRLDIETGGGITRGMVVAERRPWIEAAANAEVAMRLDVERFLENFRRRVIEQG